MKALITVLQREAPQYLILLNEAPHGQVVQWHQKEVKALIIVVYRERLHNTLYYWMNLHIWLKICTMTSQGKWRHWSLYSRGRGFTIPYTIEWGSTWSSRTITSKGNEGIDYCTTERGSIIPYTTEWGSTWSSCTIALKGNEDFDHYTSKYTIEWGYIMLHCVMTTQANEGTDEILQREPPQHLRTKAPKMPISH